MVKIIFEKLTVREEYRTKGGNGGAASMGGLVQILNPDTPNCDPDGILCGTTTTSMDSPATCSVIVPHPDCSIVPSSPSPPHELRDGACCEIQTIVV